MQRPIVLSLRRTVLLLFLFQTSIFAATGFFAGFSISVYLIYLISSGLFHLLVLLGLTMMQKEFVVIKTGFRLEKVNLPNLLTIYRLSVLPSVTVLLIFAMDYSINAVLFVLIATGFITDLFDGLVARKTDQITRIGKFLDSVSDYLVLSVLTLVFLIYSIIPLWLFIMIMARGLIMLIGMPLIALKHGHWKPETTFLGKASVFALMVLYAVEALGLVIPMLKESPWIIPGLEYFCGVIIFVTYFDKILMFRREIQNAKKLRENEET